MSRRLLAASLVLSLLPLSPAYAWDPERQAPQPPPPDEAAAPAPPDGLYVVTDVYVADVVTRSGARTTYATTTVRQTPGTYARVLQTVGTGERSGLDERSANTRLALADGRLAAGTYYETFVPSDAGLASVGVVFFHDDAELARERSSPAPVGQGARSATPEDGLRAGLSPLSQGEPLTRLEVLRGRRIALWARATADGAPVRVLEWRLLAGEVVTIGPLAGGGEEPLVARWDRLAPPGEVWTLRLLLTIEPGPGGEPRSLELDVAVAVRSPALIE